MKMICILCDTSFPLHLQEAKKLKKHPQRIQLCPHCKQRIESQVNKRKSK